MSKRFLTAAAIATPIAAALALPLHAVAHVAGGADGAMCFAGGYLTIAGVFTADPLMGMIGGLLLVACA